MARIGQEEAAAELPAANSGAQRQKMGAYHYAQGRAFEDRSFLEKALAEYRRALILDPTSVDARVGYARIYKSLGFPAKYLSELQVLARLGTKDTFVSDEIERLTSVLSESVSRTWGYDQYNHSPLPGTTGIVLSDRPRYLMPVYTLPAGNRLVHALASDDLSKYFASLLERYDSISTAMPKGKTGVPMSARASPGSTRRFVRRGLPTPTISSSWQSTEPRRSSQPRSTCISVARGPDRRALRLSARATTGSATRS